MLCWELPKIWQCQSCAIRLLQFPGWAAQSFAYPLQTEGAKCSQYLLDDYCGVLSKNFKVVILQLSLWLQSNQVGKLWRLHHNPLHSEWWALVKFTTWATIVNSQSLVFVGRPGAYPRQGEICYRAYCTLAVHFCISIATSFVHRQAEKRQHGRPSSSTYISNVLFWSHVYSYGILLSFNNLGCSYPQNVANLPPK